MAKYLVIVESPAKAKTINKYLGKDFIVKSSVGHIRDLPKGGKDKDSKAIAVEAAKVRKMEADEKANYKFKRDKQRLFDRMGIDPEKGWKAKYETLEGKQKVVAELKKLAGTAELIYLATDLDREGEAIAWHLHEVIGGNKDYKRVVFNEITQKAIKEAFKKPTEIDYNKVNAQQTRRFLDRIVGFMLSPLLWKKVARGLSAGRVQSVAVRLLVEREKEIRAFIPQEFWTLDANLSGKDKPITKFSVVEDALGKYKPAKEAESQIAVNQLKGHSFKVIQRDDKPTSSKASAPFITSTLQQAASSQLNLGVKKTMMMAQRLYEAGHITYMRTDSTSLSSDSVNACRDYILSNFGAKYMPEKAVIYHTKAGAQEAHEAIRPSEVSVLAETLNDMEADARKLYKLIWQRFVAGQMTKAKFTSTTVEVEAGDYKLKAKGRVLEFDGYQRVMPYLNKKDDDQDLPNFVLGEVLTLQELLPEQHFTKPPARFNEASLVKELEKSGVGRPSTYASIISTIQDRGYARVENRRFFAEKIGEIVTERLTSSFSDLMDYQFTATMEQQLDDIAFGKKDWKIALDEFYKKFSMDLKQAEEKMATNQPIEIDVKCDSCYRPMQVRNASTGVFLGCSGYGLPPKERCKRTFNLTDGDEVVNANDEDSEVLQLMSRKRCSLCNVAMEPWLLNEEIKLHICGNNPDCSGVEIEKGRYKIKGYDGPLLECDKCSADMQLKDGRFGKYFSCNNESCNNTRKLLRSGQPAPPKIDPIVMEDLKCEKVDDHYVLRDGAAGLFLAASRYPKHRETRAPRVSELRPYKEQLDPKYHYLLTTADVDPDGNDIFIRYSRKTKEVYVRAEEKGKPTGWSAFYSANKWVSKK